MRKVVTRFHQLPASVNKGRIRDVVRGTMILETPEERVRQVVLKCLIDDYGYPLSTLQCEEPIARGTADRKRADVIVRLAHRPGVLVEQPSESGPADLASFFYDCVVRECESLRMPGLTVVNVPNFLDLVIQGERSRLRVGGFRLRAEGIALVVAATPELIELGYPPIIDFLLSGDGRSPTELALGDQLGIRQINMEQQTAFLEASGGYGQPFSQAVRATDAAHGYVLAPYSEGDCSVLWDIDLAEANVAEPADVEAGPRSTIVSAANPVVGTESEGPAENDISQNANVPLIVVECKAPYIGISEAARKQARTYAEALGAKFIVLTNGNEVQCFARNASDWEPIDELPSYIEVLATPSLSVQALAVGGCSAMLPAGYPSTDLLWSWLRSHGIEPVCLSEGQRIALCRLVDMLFLDDEIRAAAAFNEIGIIGDLGTMSYKSGYPGSSEFRGRYRTVEVGRCAEKPELVIGVVIAGQLFHKCDWTEGAIPFPFGPCLNVGVAEAATFQNTLQLDLRRFLHIDGDEALIWYDGRLTAGRGAAPRKDVLDAVAKSAPHLIRNDRIELFRFNILEKATAASATELMNRLVQYALIRTEVRAQVKAARKAASVGHH